MDHRHVRRRDLPYTSRLLRPRLVFALTAVLAPVACGGSGSDQTTPTPQPAQNPCLTASTTEVDAGAAVPPASKPPARPLDSDPRGTIFDVLWDHRSAAARTASSSRLVAPRATMDAGDVAVVQDDADLISPPNTFDLRGDGLRAVPNTAGGFDIVRIDAAFRSELGSRVTLGDDDSVSEDILFGFRFFNRIQTRAFVNSDGNITFGEGDNASTERNVARLVGGAPRVAPFLSDLDPSCGGSVFVRSAADRFTATWCGVRVFDSTQQATLQTSFFPDGSVELKYADTAQFSATEGVVGVSPGHTGVFAPVDLSTATTTGPVSGGAGAVGERFADRITLDLASVAAPFYRTHADAFDQLVIWTDTTLTAGGAFSFEVTVANEIAGNGISPYDASAEFGSAGRLRSVVQMDNIGKFPDDPTQKFLGENNTLSVVGQEVGHRWLAFLQFSDHNRQRSEALLGRDQAHWSFFFNSDASVMEGNRIQDLGGGSFRTVGAVEKYSLLDQYAMGLVRDIDVPPFFYVESPANIQPAATASSAPRVGVTFNGTRRDVLIQDVIEVMGQRVPSADDSPKLLRQAFLFVVSRGRTPAAAAIAKIDRIRRAWESFFTTATEGRARTDTRLLGSS